MASEREYPELEEYKSGFSFKLRRGFIPWITYTRKNAYFLEFHKRYQWVKSYCGDRRVLDVPCGIGWGTSLLNNARFRLGIDIDEKSIERAISEYSSASNLEFVVGSMENLAVDSESIDVVSCLEGIEHVPVEVGDRFLQEASRVLKVDGELLISSPHCPTKPHSGNPYHIHEYEPDEIIQAVTKYFDVIEVTSSKVASLIVTYIRAKKKCNP